jgi:hypothetical protein
VRARELAEPFPVVHLGTDAMEATRLLVDQALPGLVVVDQDGLPLFILPGSQVCASHCLTTSRKIGPSPRWLASHSGLTRAQLDHVAETEGIPTAIRFAIWRSKRRNRGRRMVEYGRRLSSTTSRRDRGFWRR